MARVRVTVEVENDHVHAIMRRYAARTVDEAVDLALRNLADQPMTRTEALAMRGAHAIDDLPAE
jgi:Arc/MetJ family transcription regulator